MEILSKILNVIKEANPNISKSDFEKMTKKVEQKIKNEPPPSIAIIGETGVGKSSTLNALFNSGQGISHTKACTSEESKIEINTDNGSLIVYDMPGLSESIESQEKHLETYARVLNKVDIAFWIFDAQNRAVANIQQLLKNEITEINPEIVNRIVFAINKVDLVHPGADAWIKRANLPSEEQEENIKNRIIDIQEKMQQALPNWNGSIVGYSAEKRYNLPQLFSCMLDSVSKKRKWVISSRKSLANYLELVDPTLLPKDKVPEKSIFSNEEPSIQKLSQLDVLKKKIGKMTDSDIENLKNPKDFLSILGIDSSEKN